MATLISIASGNFTSASTWALCDATSELDSESSSSQINTGNQDSQTFTPGAITVQGIALKAAGRNNTVSGQFTVILRNSTDGTNVASVSCNSTDLLTTAVSTSGTSNGWFAFYFPAPITLIAAKAYVIRLTTTISNTVPLFFRGPLTSPDWSRELITTTTQAPAVNDRLFVCGKITGPGTATSVTVTMNNTATTTFGDVDAYPLHPSAITINRYGTLDYGTAAATNYYLRVRGLLQIHVGGTLNIGTFATPIPNGSTAILEFDTAVMGNVDTGVFMRTNSTFNAYGYPRGVLKAFLAANASASATSLTTDVSTGWKNGETIAIASTTQTAGQLETKALTADATTTTLTIAAITNAHSGTSPTQAEVAVLERNVKIRGIDSTHRGFVNMPNGDGDGQTLTWRYVQCYNFGSNSGNRRGLEQNVNASTGLSNVLMDIQYSSFHDGTAALLAHQNPVGTTIFSHNVMHSTSGDWVITISANAPAYTGDDNLFMGSGAYGNHGYGSSTAGYFQSITNSTWACVGTNNFSQNSYIGAFTFTGNTFHTCGTCLFAHVQFSPLQIFGNLTVWRNTSHGIQMQNQCTGFIIDGVTVFGCSSVGIYLNNSQGMSVFFKNLNLSGDTTFTQTYGIYFNQAGFFYVEIDNGTFGVATGIKNAHSSGDIYISSNTNQTVQVVCNNVTLASSTPVFGLTGTDAMVGSFVKVQKHAQTAGNHKSFFRWGITTSDTVIFKDTAPSERLTPNSASNKFYSGPKRVAVTDGDTVAVSVWVRKSSSGDAGGANYNGNQQRLIQRRNNALGITADVVLATAAAAVGTWEQLSGTTSAVSGDDGVLEFWVDCDGTAGWVNIDDWFAA